MGHSADDALASIRCPHKCDKHPPVTTFVRWHPFRSDTEVRRCPGCGKEAFFPAGKRFKTLSEMEVSCVK